MRETVHTAAAALSHPRAFLIGALADARRSRRIGWQLFRTGLKAGRRRLLIGHLWLILPALATAVVCVGLQSARVFTVGATELPYGLHVLTGIILWQTFVDALNAPLQELEGSRHMIARSRIPHEALFVAGLSRVALNCMVRLLLLGIAVAAMHGAPSWAALPLLPAAMLVLVLMGTALGLALAPWGLLYGDVRHGMPVALSLGFVLTPIFYPAPEGGLLSFNPLVPAMATARRSILAPEFAGSFAATAVAAAFGCVAAWLVYRLAQPHVVETLG